MVGEPAWRRGVLSAALLLALVAGPAAGQQAPGSGSGELLRDMLERLDRMGRELRELRDENEKMRHELDTVLNRQRQNYLDIDRRLYELEQSGGASGPSDPLDTGTVEAEFGTGDAGPDDPETTGAQPSPEATATEAAEYQAARRLLLSGGRQEETIDAFSRFLRDHPDSVYAANAQYWLAEAYYGAGDYPQALAAFSEVVARYPDSAKVADARLKTGYTYSAMERREEAEKALSDVIRDFPNTGVARLAEQKLRSLRDQGR
ncbi:MAG: tol-pal system protein YbgF [Pseudomonadota bacterium]|nr:tol-pal system protein YbgF [Pseudomonadota bacterium]